MYGINTETHTHTRAHTHPIPHPGWGSRPLQCVEVGIWSVMARVGVCLVHVIRLHSVHRKAIFPCTVASQS
jgi:hypothetical protein